MTKHEIKDGMAVKGCGFYGTVESIRTSELGSVFATIGWGQNIGIYQRQELNIKHLTRWD